MTVKAGFNLNDDSGEFFKRQFHIGSDTSEMGFHALTAASQRPLKWGACSGILLSLLTFKEIREFLSSTSQICAIIAPNEGGLSRRDMNRLREAKNASEVRSETSSKCTALTESETNTQT